MLRRRRIKKEDMVELDMVPIMNMFLVLIPFLLMSASFFQLKAVNASVPVLSQGKAQETTTQETIRLTVVVEIGKAAIHLSALSQEADENLLSTLERTFAVTDSGYPFPAFSAYLVELKQTYPKSDTLIVVPENSVRYETIVATMDAARYEATSPLFPRVVISGKLG